MHDLHSVRSLALSYDILSGEREQGTWALTVASCASPPYRILLAKLAVRAGVPLLVCLVALAASAWISGRLLGVQPDRLTVGALLLLVTLWALFWLALALWINSWQGGSAFNAVALAMAWVLLLWAVPAIVNALGTAWHPSPSRAEMVLAVRQASVDAERDRDAVELRYLEEHPQDTQGIHAVSGQRAVAVVFAADRRADEVLAAHEARVQAQRRLSARLSWWVPSIRMYQSMADLSGTGHARWDRFLSELSDFHDAWQAHFLNLAQRGQRLTVADFESFPRRPTSAGVRVWLRDSLWGFGLTVVVLVAQAALFLLLARRRLARSE